MGNSIRTEKHWNPNRLKGNEREITPLFLENHRKWIRRIFWESWSATTRKNMEWILTGRNWHCFSNTEILLLTVSIFSVNSRPPPTNYIYAPQFLPERSPFIALRLDSPFWSPQIWATRVWSAFTPINKPKGFFCVFYISFALTKCE